MDTPEDFKRQLPKSAVLRFQVSGVSKKLEPSDRGPSSNGLFAPVLVFSSILTTDQGSVFSIH